MTPHITHQPQTESRRLNEEEIQRDIRYSEIFIRKLQYSNISKFGKVKKTRDRVQPSTFMLFLQQNTDKHFKTLQENTWQRR